MTGTLEFSFDLDRCLRLAGGRCDLEPHALLFAPIPLLTASDALLAFCSRLEAMYKRRATGDKSPYVPLSSFKIGKKGKYEQVWMDRRLT